MKEMTSETPLPTLPLFKPEMLQFVSSLIHLTAACWKAMN